MDSVRQYLIQDLNEEELESYNEYVAGDETSTAWIEKASERREPLLLFELKCQFEDKETGLCGNWIGISETGECRCNIGHECYDVVLHSIRYIELGKKIV